MLGFYFGNVLTKKTTSNGLNINLKFILPLIFFYRELREDHLPYLLAKVRLPLLTPQFLSDTVASEELIRSSHRCR